MLAGAGLSRAWPHDRAHWFFSRARWDPDELGLAVARLVAGLLVPTGEPVTVAIDDTLFRWRGKKVWAASWFHDGSAPGPAKTGYGNNWVIAAVVVKLPALRRPVAIPVLAKLVIKNTSSASRLWLARRMTELLADALPGRRHPRGRRFRLRRRGAEEAAAPGDLDHPAAQGRRPVRAAAARTGKRGRPRQKGDRLPALAKLADTAAFTEVTVTRYGKTAAISAATITCLWPSVFGTRAVTVVLIRDRSAASYDLALITTDTIATAAQVDRAIRQQMVDRGRDRRRLAGLRRRAGPQPHRPRGRADCPVPARLPGHHHLLVRHRRARPRRRGRSPGPRPLVRQQGPAVHRRHGRQAPPCHHRCQI